MRKGHVFYIPSLDGIRSVAAFLVFVGHAGWHDIVPGGFGVTVFFFLSGYIITTLLRREFEKTGTVSLRNFYLRRAYRIFPPMYIVLFMLMGFAAAGIFEHSMKVGPVLAQIFHLTNYYLIKADSENIVPFTAAYWSLAVEEHFYLGFPLLFLFSVKRWGYSRVSLLFLGVCVAVVMWRLILVYGLQVSSANRTYMATDTRLDSLLFGCIMGVWMNPMLDRDIVVDKRVKICLLIISVALLLFTFLYRDSGFRETLRYSIQGLALFPIFWLSIRHSEWSIFRWLNWRPVQFCGVVSYTFYLTHVMMLDISGKKLGYSGGLRAVTAFVLTLAFASVMYLLVERPVANLRRKLHRD